MKKIIIISAVFPPEQVTSAFMNYDLAHELAKEYDVTVLRPYPTRPIGAEFNSAEIDDKSFNTVTIDSYTHPQSELLGRFKESNDFGRKCANYIRSHYKEVDFVYNDGWQLFGLYRVAKIAHKYGIPYMVPIQDIYPECLFTNKNYPNFIKSFIKLVLSPVDSYYQRHAACVRTISQEMRDYLSETRNVPIKNYLVVNNWQEDGIYLKEFPERAKDDKRVFAYVGSINEHANVELMIRAFAKAGLENAEFRIYGGGNKRDYCVYLANKLGAKNIIFDMVSREQVPFAQSQADVLILALPKGNGNLCLPSKMTSYMLSGKPVLASVDEDSATARIINAQRCGTVVAPDDEAQLSDVFTLFSKMPLSELKNMGYCSRKYSMAELTKKINLEKVVEKIVNIIKVY